MHKKNQSLLDKMHDLHELSIYDKKISLLKSREKKTSSKTSWENKGIVETANPA